MSRPELLLSWILLLTVLPGTSRAQRDFNQIHDSLLTGLRTSPNDTNKVYLYLETGLHYEASQLDSAGYYYRLAGTLSEQLKYPKGVVRYINYYTYILNVKGKLTEGLQLNQRALAIAARLPDEVLYAKCLGNTGASWQLLEDYEAALGYYLKAIPLLQKHHQDRALGVGYANVTSLYDQLNQYAKAEQYGRKAVDLARRMRAPRDLNAALINLSVPLQHQRKYAETKKMLAEALQLSRQLHNGYAEASVTQNLSNLALLQGQHEQAQQYARQALTLGQTLDLPAVVADALLSIGIAHLHHQQYAQAAQLAAQGEQLIGQHGLKDHLVDYLLLRSDAELGLGHLAQFDAYRQRYDSLREHLVGQKVVLNAQRLEAQFQSQAQAQQINQLRQARQIQNLTLARKNNLLYATVAVLLALLLATALIFRSLRSQRIINRQTDQLQRQRIRELEQEKHLLAVDAVLRGQEQERSRLAKDLHDGLGGLLSGVKMTLAASLSTTSMQNHLLPDEAARSLERAIGMLDKSIAELRRVARNMMPEALIRFGLVEALRDYCAYIGQSAPLTVRFQAIGLPERLSATTEITLFRIAQELLNNVLKHAGAQEVIVQLVGHDGQCSLTVEDNGTGFDLGLLEHSRGSGWSSVRSRVDYLGGQLDVQSQPGTGTSVLIEVPAKPDGASGKSLP